MSVEDRPNHVGHIPRARVYTRPNSNHLWFSYLDRQGKLVRRSAGTGNRTEAWAALLQHFEDQGELKFEEAVIHFFEQREDELSANTLRQYAFAVQALRPVLEGRLMKSILPADVRKHIDDRRGKVSDATIKRELAFLSSLYTFLVEDMDLHHLDNPVKKVRKSRLKEEARTRFLSREEYERALAACTSPVHVRIIQTAVLTGMRHGELLDFAKSWIDWRRREIHIPAEVTKGQKARVIPMSDELIDVLKEQAQSTEGAHLFCYLDRKEQRWVPFTTFKNFFEGVRTRAGLEDVRFHDLRHTFGSWWVQGNGDLLVLKDVMGHSTVRVTERYAHIDTSTLHRTRRRVDEHIEGTVTRFLKHTARRKK